MEIIFLAENSGDVAEKIRSLTGESDKINQFFHERSYGPNLNYLIIRVLCLGPRLEDLFPPLPPRYNATPRNYMHRGERLEKPALSFEFDLRLDYKVYKELEKVQEVFARDLISSMAVISTNKKLQDFNLPAFKADLVQCLSQLGWLEKEAG